MLGSHLRKSLCGAFAPSFVRQGWESSLHVEFGLILQDKGLCTPGGLLSSRGECQVVAMVSCRPVIPELQAAMSTCSEEVLSSFVNLCKCLGVGFPPETRLILGDFVIR